MSTASSSSNKRFAVYHPSTSPPQRSRDDRLSSTSSTSTPTHQQSTVGSLKICAVCCDKSTGMHFGAMTCEGCKGFFRRSVQKKGSFVCLFEGKCTINKLTRKHCQSCRYKSCLLIGMKTELVMTEKEVSEKRELIRRNREKRLQQHKLEEEERKQKEEQQQTADAAAREAAHHNNTPQHSPQQPQILQPPMRMTMEHRVLIEVLLKGHQESYDFDYKEFESFRGLNQILAPDNKSGAMKNESFAWLVATLNRGNTDGAAAEAAASAIPCTSSKTADDDEPVQHVSSASKRAVAVARALTSSSRHPPDCDVFHSLHGTSNDKPSTSSSEPTTNAVATPSTSAASSLVVKRQMEASKEQAASCSDIASTSTMDSAPIETEEKKRTESMKYLHGLLRSQGFSLSMIKDSKSILLLQHFCDIMSWGIRKVIEFCKGIPEFVSLTLVDQIFLLKGGCLEMLVLRSYFAFASNGNTYMSDKFQYQPSDFLKAGGSKEFVEAYNRLHLRMRKMKLQVEEICLLLALVLFSPDRQGLDQRDKVDEMQVTVALALQSFEYTHKPREKARATYCEILLILPMMRTINKLFSENLEDLQHDYEGDMNPLIFEVNMDTSRNRE